MKRTHSSVFTFFNIFLSSISNAREEFNLPDFPTTAPLYVSPLPLFICFLSNFISSLLSVSLSCVPRFSPLSSPPCLLSLLPTPSLLPLSSSQFQESLSLSESVILYSNSFLFFSIFLFVCFFVVTCFLFLAFVLIFFLSGF